MYRPGRLKTRLVIELEDATAYATVKHMLERKASLALSLMSIDNTTNVSLNAACDVTDVSVEAVEYPGALS